MIVIPGNGAANSERRGPTFTGEVWAAPVLPRVDGVTVATIFFTPGARTFWHHHEHGQLLQVLAGSGFVCPYGEKPHPLRAGDTVWVPPGERHWHGAAPGSFLTHTAVSLGTTTWLDEVSEADYVSSDTRSKGGPT